MKIILKCYRKLHRGRIGSMSVTHNVGGIEMALNDDLQRENKFSLINFSKWN